MAGKGKVSESRKAELRIGAHAATFGPGEAITPPIPNGVPCQHVRQAQASGKGTQVNTGPWIPSHDLAKGQVNRVSLPGDHDYA